MTADGGGKSPSQDLDSSETSSDESKMGSDSGGGGNTDLGLCNVLAIWYLVLWYFFSGCTLFLNKYILTSLSGDAAFLGACQMISTMVCGYMQMSLDKETKRTKKPEGFMKQMTIVGGLRFGTVFLGLMALEYVAVSFTETVKSSAPAFTVVISYLILGQGSVEYNKFFKHAW